MAINYGKHKQLYLTKPQYTMSKISQLICQDMTNGFHLHKANLKISNADSLLKSSDDWEILAGILLYSQIGKFDPLELIPTLLRRNNEFLFWKAANELLGYAGSWELIRHSFDLHEKNDETIYFTSISLANCCGLWIVDPLIQTYNTLTTEESRYQIQRHLSYLLEPENELIWIGPHEEIIVEDDTNAKTILDIDEYENTVRTTLENIMQSTTNPNAAFYEGKILDISEIASTLHSRLTSGDPTQGRIYREAMIVEAVTGVDLSCLFDENGVLQNLTSSAILEDFIENQPISEFDVGNRYFFGNLIPN